MKTLYKFVKCLVVLALIAIAACWGLKRTKVDCGDLQKYVDVVFDLVFPDKDGEIKLPTPPDGGRSPGEGRFDELIDKIKHRINLLQNELGQTNKSIEEVAKKINEWQKEIESGERFANLLYDIIEEADYPTTVLSQTYDSEEDVKGTLESVLSQLEARQTSVDNMKSLMREIEKERDAIKKQIAELEVQLRQVEKVRAQRKQDGRVEIDVGTELQNIEDEDKVAFSFGAPDLSSLAARLAKEEEKIKKVGEKKLEEEQREKQFEEYYVKYNARRKAKNGNSTTKTRRDFERSDDDE